MIRQTAVALAAALSAVFIPSSHAWVEDFSTSPFPTWSFGVGDNSNSQFAWNNDAPKYSGDAPGSLTVNLNSALPTARLDRPIGATFTQSDNFTLKVRFSFNVISAPTDTAAQIAFGLVNSALTGGDRTGSFSNFFSSDFFHTVEFNYFPQLSTWNPATPGPTLTPVVAGAQKGGGDAFSNFAAIFGPASDLGANPPPLITELPEDVVLEAVLDYDGFTRELSLTMYQVQSDGSLTLLLTGVPPLDLDTQFSYDTNYPFVVDTVAIMAYQDGYTDPNNPSLVATVTFERIEFIPEPTTGLLVGLGVTLAAISTRWRRS
ncbi:MAG: PEP-CTERM sorting domain-containing protein [Verrucomicrobiae bacterium]|nr:PEP-CTERM sorting domain-containing protein [Verrucomicrobiae bacterium]